MNDREESKLNSIAIIIGGLAGLPVGYGVYEWGLGFMGYFVLFPAFIAVILVALVVGVVLSHWLTRDIDT